MTLKQKVMSGLYWTAGAKFILQLMTWCVTIIVMRLLAPKDYGLMEIALVFINFFSMINEMGLGAAIVQRNELDVDKLKSIFGYILLVSALFSAILSLFSPIISAFYNEPQLNLVLQVLSISFLFSGFAVVSYSLILRDQQYRELAIIDFASGIAGSAVTLVLALNNFGVWSLVVGMLAIRVVTVVGCQWYRPFIVVPVLKYKGLGDIFRFSGHVVIARVLWFVYTSAAASLIIGKILGSATLGLYGVGLYLACLPMEKVGGIINQVAFPAFSSIQNNSSLARVHLLKVMRILFVLSIPVFWGMSCVSPEIIHLFLGNKWEAAIFPFQIIALIVPLRMVRNIFMPALLGFGRSDINLRMEIVAVIAMPLSFYIGTNWNLEGISYAWLFVFPIVFVINFLQSSRVFNIRLVDVLKSLYLPFICGAFMYLSVYWARMLLGSIVGEAILFAELVAVGAFSYLGISYIINKNGLIEVLNLVKK